MNVIVALSAAREREDLFEDNRPRNSALLDATMATTTHASAMAAATRARARGTTPSTSAPPTSASSRARPLAAARRRRDGATAAPTPHTIDYSTRRRRGYTSTTTLRATTTTTTTTTASAYEAFPEKWDVLRLAAEQRRGVGHSEEDRAAMEAAIDALVAAAAKRESDPHPATSPKRLTARWRLVWTSEKETLFLLEKFTAEAYQVIDVIGRKLANEVVFKGNGSVFVVDSAMNIASESKCAFDFIGARYEFDNPFKWVLRLPPVGRGWFENVYVDETMRCARDSRGDTLVVVRDE